jgi:hypothetical protein
VLTQRGLEASVRQVCMQILACGLLSVGLCWL